MKKWNLYAIGLSVMLGMAACAPDARVGSSVSESENIVITEGTDSQLSANSEESFVLPTVTYDTSAQYAATILQDGDALTGGTYTATGTDESVLEASGNVTATVTGSVLNKADGSASSADASSFRGVNAGVRVYGNANVTLKDCAITASAANATGVFAYENGVVTLHDCTVDVTGGGAGGVQVAGGGTLYGYDLTVNSASKAAIRSDRGGGTMVIDGGTYTSTGKNGCPAIYSTADITVKNATCVSENSRAVIIEGKNSVTLENCVLSGNDQSTKEGSVKANVLLYQSASGDASVGTSVFSMKGGSIKANTGAMFYCTNTASVVNLEGAELELSSDGTLLIVSAGRWGKDGKNGGNCTFNAVKQKLEGTITVDPISSLSLNLTDGSSFTGVIAGDGQVALTLDQTSTWTLTGDSSISSFTGDPSCIITNGYTLYVNGSTLTGTR
ncbi:MAG: hypothetical protein IJ773_03815 [Lachnospiraceae bacterium]|nr:hypothetical protein [Lachnospiraceae bacterium]